MNFVLNLRFLGKNSPGSWGENRQQDWKSSKVDEEDKGIGIEVEQVLVRVTEGDRGELMGMDYKASYYVDIDNDIIEGG